MCNYFRGIYTVFDLLLPRWKCQTENVKRRLQISYPYDRSEECGEKSPTVRELLLCQVAENPIRTSHKVTVVGVGQVGMASAVSFLMQNVTKQLVLIGRRKEKVTGEKLDLRHGSVFMQNALIFAGTDLSVSADSQLVVVAAGARQKKDESRLALVQRNADIFKGLIPELVKHSPNCILLVVTNPVDVMTYVAWKLSGLPCHRVIGSGCALDSARFRFFIARRLGVRPSSVHSWIIGEHGDSSVPVWSCVNVAGVRLRELNPALGSSDDKENWAEVHKKVVKSNWKVYVPSPTDHTSSYEVNTLCSRAAQCVRGDQPEGLHVVGHRSHCGSPRARCHPQHRGDQRPLRLRKGVLRHRQGRVPVAAVRAGAGRRVARTAHAPHGGGGVPPAQVSRRYPRSGVQRQTLSTVCGICYEWIIVFYVCS